jgi:uncharacterized membrane protein YfcA
MILFYPILLFFISFLIGIVAVIGGIGGGSLFVPLVSAFFPFSFDFVRGAGLFVALGSSLSAGPKLIESGYGNLRLALPFALAGAAFSILGARLGLFIDDRIVSLLLGILMIAVSVFMLLKKRGNLEGKYTDDQFNIQELLKPGRRGKTAAAFICFSFIGFIAGMFGLGAGWAGVPVLNLLVGAPMRIAAGTSNLIISVNASSAIWVYLKNNALFPMIAIPSFLGMYIGSKIGASLLGKVKPGFIRFAVIIFLLLSGIRLAYVNTELLFFY